MAREVFTSTRIELTIEANIRSLELQVAVAKAKGAERNVGHREPVADDVTGQGEMPIQKGERLVRLRLKVGDPPSVPQGGLGPDNRPRQIDAGRWSTTIRFSG